MLDKFERFENKTSVLYTIKSLTDILQKIHFEEALQRLFHLTPFNLSKKGKVNYGMMVFDMLNDNIFFQILTIF